MSPNFITDGKGNFYLAFKTDLVSGYLPVPIPKQEPVLRWHGPKIDLEKEWYPATTFMADYLKHEVVLRLFVTADNSEIVIRPFRQIYGTGMSVKEEPTQEEDEISKLGLTDIGSVHSHCVSKAYASGIDEKDEKNWPGGLHLTVGELDENHYDLHARFTWDVPGEEFEGKLVRAAQRTLQAPVLSDWFRLPEHAGNFVAHEPQLADSVLYHLLCKPVAAEYPDWWKEKLVAPPPPPKREPTQPGVMSWYAGNRDWQDERGPDFFGRGAVVDPPQPPRKKKGKKN